MSFISKTNIKVDLSKIKIDLNSILKLVNWPHTNQIGLTYRPGCENIWYDSVGSLYDRDTGKFFAKESDFTEFNSSTPDYLRSCLELLKNEEKIKLGRVRFMKLMPKTGLSLHVDDSVRYHLAIETNPGAFYADVPGPGGTLTHIPADGCFYKVDTTRKHFVYNAGWTPRIHLVICPVD